jgi:hypothetical protein
MASIASLFTPTRVRRFAIGLVLLAPALTLWNLAVASHSPSLTVSIGPPLRGVTTPNEQIEWSFRALADGTMQKAIADRVTEAFPARPLLIRLSNSFRKRLFGIYGAPGVVVGEDGELIEQPYLDEYCSRDLAVLLAKSAEWLPKLKEMQEFYDARGAQFIYLTSPSKAAHLPEKFIGQIVCKSRESDRKEYLPTYAQLVRATGVSIVDAASLTHSLKGRYEVNLFPQGGVHWNQLGVAHAADAVLAEINRNAGRQIAPRLIWAHTITDRPSGTDTDLADVVNVLFARPRYPVPRLTFAGGKPCEDWPASKMKILLVGGSFVHDVARMLIARGCLQRLHTYNYLVGSVRGGEGYKEVRERTNEGDLAQLREADIVILEENEAGLPGSRHARGLRRVILGE